MHLDLLALLALQEGFLKNNRGINDGHDLAEDYMSALYDRIAGHEIKMKDEGSLMSEWRAPWRAALLLLGRGGKGGGSWLLTVRRPAQRHGVQ